MSKGLGKIQREIMECLESGDEDSYYYPVFSMTGQYGVTGSKQSVYRALKGLVDRGLVEYKLDKSEPWAGGLPRWERWYIRTDRLEDNAKLEAFSANEKKLRDMADQAEADKLGMSVEEYVIHKFASHFSGAALN